MLKIIGGGTIGNGGVCLAFPDWFIEINAMPDCVIQADRRHGIIRHLAQSATKPKAWHHSSFGAERHQAEGMASFVIL